jgi:hypothetical protein
MKQLSMDGFDLPKPPVPTEADRERAQRQLAKIDKGAAESFILYRLGMFGPTSGEDLTDGMLASGITAADHRSFGPVFQMLSQRGLIEHYGVGYRRKGHGTLGAVIWRLTPKARA